MLHKCFCNNVNLLETVGIINLIAACDLQLIKGSRSEGGPRRGLINELDPGQTGHQRCYVKAVHVQCTNRPGPGGEKDQEKETQNGREEKDREAKKREGEKVQEQEERGKERRQQKETKGREKETRKGSEEINLLFRFFFFFFFFFFF